MILSVPRFPADLPPGPFRARLATVTDVRALLPTLLVRATQSPGVRRNRAGKIVATATVYEHVRIDDDDRPRWTIEIDDLAGYAKYASRARAALAEMGLSWAKADTFGLAAASAGIRLAGRSEPSGIALDPMMPAVAGFRAVLGELSGIMLANWQGTIDQLDPEFLHDLRVAVRRTRSMVAEGKKVLPPPIIACAEERFGWLGALTGPARDLDVHLINWSTDTGRLVEAVVATLEPVHALLERRSASAHATLASALQSTEATDLLKAAELWWRGPAPDEPSGVEAQKPLAKVVTRRIARAHANLVRTRTVDPPRHVRRAGPRPPKGCEEAALSARVLRRPAAGRSEKGLCPPAQGLSGQSRRAPRRRDPCRRSPRDLPRPPCGRRFVGDDGRDRAAHRAAGRTPSRNARGVRRTLRRI